MSVKSKILILAVAAPIVIFALVIAIVAINFRENGIDSAKQKSLLTAEFVRDALTSHMVNGIMDKRDYFLDKIEHSQNIKSLWMVRSKSVDSQFGESKFKEQARDSIDREVLNKGIPEFILNENSQEAVLRVTIPYIATSKGSPNCLQCHDAKEGEVLGAISMIFDVNDIRSAGMITIMRVLIISLIFIVISAVLVQFIVAPYLKFFNSLKTAIEHAEDGDFSYRVETKLKDETGDIAKWLNTLYDNLQSTIGAIEKQITFLFSANEHSYSKNPLYKTREIINELADIYKFKRTIELDSSKQDIYKRIIHVMIDKLKIMDFIIFETDKDGKKQGLTFVVHNGAIVQENKSLLELNLCRAYRSDSEIHSDDFYNVCECCIVERQEQDYICFPYSISKNSGLLISLRSHISEEMARIKTITPVLRNYLDAAKPVIESKILTEMLRDSSLRDGMTGLHNRRFLEEYFEKAASQANRSKLGYAILMIDIDYFKMVNDTYGHDVGDIIIKGLSEILKENIRASDLAIRFGGEEFLIALYNPTEEGAFILAEKLRKNFEAKHFSVNHETIKKTISIGISYFPNDADAIWKAIKFADIALYAAKHGGRNKVVKFDKSMKETNGDY